MATWPVSPSSDRRRTDRRPGSSSRVARPRSPTMTFATERAPLHPRDLRPCRQSLVRRRDHRDTGAHDAARTRRRQGRKRAREARVDGRSRCGVLQRAALPEREEESGAAGPQSTTELVPAAWHRRKLAGARAWSVHVVCLAGVRNMSEVKYGHLLGESLPRPMTCLLRSRRLVTAAAGAALLLANVSSVAQATDSPPPNPTRVSIAVPNAKAPAPAPDPAPAASRPAVTPAAPPVQAPAPTPAPSAGVTTAAPATTPATTPKPAHHVSTAATRQSRAPKANSHVTRAAGTKHAEYGDQAEVHARAVAGSRKDAGCTKGLPRRLRRDRGDHRGRSRIHPARGPTGRRPPSPLQATGRNPQRRQLRLRRCRIPPETARAQNRGQSRVGTEHPSLTMEGRRSPQPVHFSWVHPPGRCARWP